MSRNEVDVDFSKSEGLTYCVLYKVDNQLKTQYSASQEIFWAELRTLTNEVDLKVDSITPFIFDISMLSLHFVVKFMDVDDSNDIKKFISKNGWELSGNYYQKEIDGQLYYLSIKEDTPDEVVLEFSEKGL